MEDDASLEEIAASVIGREIKVISKPNAILYQRLQSILEDHITKKDESVFIQNMVSETGGTVEQSLILLQRMLSAIID